MMARGKRSVEVVAAASRRSRAVSALAARALLASVLIGSLLALAPGASAADESMPEASAQETASHEPASVDSLLARGKRALKDRDAASAERLFSEVLSLDRGEHRALRGLAIVGFLEDDPDKAIKYARKAVKADKKNSDYHFILGNGYGMKASRGGLRAIY